MGPTSSTDMIRRGALNVAMSTCHVTIYYTCHGHCNQIDTKMLKDQATTHPPGDHAMCSSTLGIERVKQVSAFASHNRKCVAPWIEHTALERDFALLYLVDTREFTFEQ
jgi:hypothetical protein